MRSRVAAVAVVVSWWWCAPARAQGGHIGEGPGWELLFVVGWVLSSLVLGTIALAAILVLRAGAGGTRRLRSAVVGGYLLAFPATAVAALVGLFTESVWSAVIVMIAPVAIYLAVLHRRWRRGG